MRHLHPLIPLALLCACSDATLDTVRTVEIPYWRSGDDIPGWPDYECETYYLDLGYHLPVSRLALDLRPAPPGAEAPSRLDVALNLERVDVQYPDAHALFIAVSTAAVEGFPGQGAWPTSLDGEGRGTNGYARGLLWGELLDGVHGTEGTWNADASICIERFRPDEIRGWLRFDAPGESTGVHPWPESWEDFVVRFPFDVMLPLPTATGWDDGLPDAEVSIQYGGDGGCYADVWPWDAITDEGVKFQLQERYRPVGEGC